MTDTEAYERALIERLIGALGTKAVLSGPELPERNLSDRAFLAPTRPLALVRPADTEQVAAAMRLCHEAGVPATPQGGMTGLCGGAHPTAGGIALSLERLVGIEDIDPDGMTMTVLAGTPLETIQQAADRAGLFFALDLGARGSCAIGGNLSTNAGGNRVIRYGMTRDLVLGLEVVLADGTIVPMLNRMLKNNTGYDLKQLFIGAEGTLGVITRVVLRLHPKPGCVAAAMCVVSGYDRVLEVLRTARASLGPMLSAFEVMWGDYWHLATERVPGSRAPVAIGSGSHVLLAEMQGLDEPIDGPRFASWLEMLFERGVLQDGVVAQSLAETSAFWRTRDAAAEFSSPAVLGPHPSYDIGLPVSRMQEFVDFSKPALLEALGAESVHYGHIADGNMHIVAWVPGAAPQPVDAISAALYETVRRFGGTISAEHGIGLVKKNYLDYSRDPAEITLMRRLKHGLDPRGTLNPAKIFDGDARA
ncbi:MAG: FAD-binding oxidoreductase [Burkholderiaceae bacterium]